MQGDQLANENIAIATVAYGKSLQCINKYIPTVTNEDHLRQLQSHIEKVIFHFRAKLTFVQLKKQTKLPFVTLSVKANFLLFYKDSSTFNLKDFITPSNTLRWDQYGYKQQPATEELIQKFSAILPSINNRKILFSFFKNVKNLLRRHILKVMRNC
jgi:hypothetical protein